MAAAAVEMDGWMDVDRDGVVDRGRLGECDGRWSLVDDHDGDDDAMLLIFFSLRLLDPRA